MADSVTVMDKKRMVGRLTRGIEVEACMRARFEALLGMVPRQGFCSLAQFFLRLNICWIIIKYGSCATFQGRKSKNVKNSNC